MHIFSIIHENFYFKIITFNEMLLRIDKLICNNITPIFIYKY